MRAILLAGTTVMGLLGAAPAHAWSCGGEVHGLSRHYNPATASGFLAVRAGPRSSASQIGELFNGDEVVILDQRGNWYQIDAQGVGIGWAHSRWIRPYC